jgi:hypothetical protein
MANKTTMYRAKAPAFVEIRGVEYHVHEGDLVREGHELLKAMPDHFVPADDVVRFDVEQATAAPGEKRGE